MTTRRAPSIRPAPAAPLPEASVLDAPLPGTPAFAQGLSDWAYGKTPPTTPDELTLWRGYFQAHLERMPPLLRERTREVFRPFGYPQTITQHGTLAGIAVALLMMQIAPRLLGNTDAALALPLPLAALSGLAAMFATREYLWTVWTARFRSLDLTPPARAPRRSRARKGRRA